MSKGNKSHSLAVKHFEKKMDANIQKSTIASQAVKNINNIY